MNNYLKIPDDFVLNLPPEEKNELGYTPSQTKEIEKQIVKDTSKSKGAWARFVKAQEEAERATVPKLEDLPILNRKITDMKSSGARTGLKAGGSDAQVMPKNSKILDYIDTTIAMYEPENATKEQKQKLEKKMSKQDEYNTYFNKKSEKYYNKKEPTSPVKINFDLNPMRTAYLGTRGLWSNIKNSSLYKLLDDPKVMGVELGHESIVEIMNLIQNSGLLKKGGRVR